MDRYSHQAREWRKREEELTAKVSGLESDKHLLQQREGMSRKLKESLVDKVSKGDKLWYLLPQSY